jgi:hypothetical protein
MTDDPERRVAEMERSYPGWLILWGCYTRLFWAFPRFSVPQGTIVSAADPDRLLADMHSVELEARASQLAAARNPQQVAASSSPPSHSQLPRRLSRGQAQRGGLPRVAPATDALAVASRQEQTSGPSLVPRPRVPAPPVRGTAAAALPGQQRAGARPATRSHDPYAADPHEFDPYAADPHEFDPYAADPHEFDPYAADPYESDPYSSDPYDSDPYDSDPYDSNSAWQS